MCIVSEKAYVLICQELSPGSAYANCSYSCHIFYLLRTFLMDTQLTIEISEFLVKKCNAIVQWLNVENVMKMQLTNCSSERMQHLIFLE